jgi:hypothetical protein
MRLRQAFLLVLLIPATCGAQSLMGIGVRAGYTVSSSFTGKSGLSGSLQGPEVGVDIPIGLPLPINGLGGLQFNISPSFFSATGGWGGSPVQGNVYRFVGTARFSPPGSPVYFRIGAGFAYAAATQSDFTSQSAYETQIGVGLGILNNLPALKITADVTYHQSSLAQVRGWTLGLSVRF